jgi:hypothetical protein
MGWMLWDLIPSRGKMFFIFFQTSRLVLRPTEPPQRVPGALSSQVKQPGHEVEYSSTSSAEVKNECSCSNIPSICPDDVHRDILTCHVSL